LKIQGWFRCDVDLCSACRVYRVYRPVLGLLLGVTSERALQDRDVFSSWGLVRSPETVSFSMRSLKGPAACNTVASPAVTMLVQVRGGERREEGGGGGGGERERERERERELLAVETLNQYLTIFIGWR